MRRNNSRHVSQALSGVNRAIKGLNIALIALPCRINRAGYLPSPFRRTFICVFMRASRENTGGGGGGQKFYAFARPKNCQTCDSLFEPQRARKYLRGPRRFFFVYNGHTRNGKIFCQVFLVRMYHVFIWINIFKCCGKQKSYCSIFMLNNQRARESEKVQVS